MKLDPTKEYQYRNGEKPWKIIWNVPSENYKIITITDQGSVSHHHEDGSYMKSSITDLDLIEVKKKIKGWVNIYVLPQTKEEADQYAAPDRIACIEIEFTEGEGL